MDTTPQDNAPIDDAEQAAADINQRRSAIIQDVVESIKLFYDAQTPIHKYCNNNRRWPDTDMHIFCDDVNKLPRGTNSGMSDVQLGLHFEAGVYMLSSTDWITTYLVERGFSRKIFCATYLNPAVEGAWELCCAREKRTTRIEFTYTGIKTNAIYILLGLPDTSKDFSTVPRKLPKTFGELFKRIHELFHFIIRSKEPQTKTVKPTMRYVREFMGELNTREQGEVDDDSLDNDTAMKDDALLRPEKILDHGTTTTGPAKSPEKEAHREEQNSSYSDSEEDKSSEQGEVDDDSLDNDTAMKDDALLRPEKILDHGTTKTGSRPAKSPEKEVSRSRSEAHHEEQNSSYSAPKTIYGVGESSVDAKSVECGLARDVPQHTRYELKKRGIAIMFESLENQLNVELNDEGAVVMDNASWVKFINSFLVNYMFQQKLTSIVFQKENPIPLDVAAGISLSGQCTTEEGPIIKTHLQHYPGDNERFVCVTTFQNHISKEYKDCVGEMINNLHFRGYSNGKVGSYLRVVSKPCLQGMAPLLEFRSGYLKEFIEASNNIKQIEMDMMDLTNWLFHIHDGVLQNAVDILGSILREKGELQAALHVKSYGELNTNCNDGEKLERDKEMREQQIKDGTKYSHPIALTPPARNNFMHPSPGPLDSVDSGIWQASKHGSYVGHSDVKDKYGNHSDKYHWSKKLSMRIVTHGFTLRNKSVNKDIPEKIVTIKHGIPSSQGENPVYCKYLGYFSMGGFQLAKGNDRITLGGFDGTHLQHPGSQEDDLFHYISMKNDNETQDCIRHIFSTRCTLPFRNDLEDRMKSMIKDNGDVKVRSSGQQNILNITEMIRNTNPSLDNEECELDNEECEGCELPERPSKKNKISKEKCWHSPSFTIQSKELKNCEKILRDAVIGLPKSTKPFDLAASLPFVEELMSRDTSLKVKYEVHSTSEGDEDSEEEEDNSIKRCSVSIGPLTLNSGELIRPGTMFEETKVDEFDIITSNNNNKSIISSTNTRYPNVLHLRRLSKNDPGVGENLKAVRQAYTSNDNAQLKPLVSMLVNGEGGAITHAGNFQLKCKGGSKDMPTIILPTKQVLNSVTTKTLMNVAANQLCINVFIKGIYIGLFYIKKVVIRKSTHKEAQSNMEHLKKLMQELALDKDIKKRIAIEESDMSKEMSHMMVMGPSFLFVPVNPIFHLKWHKTEKPSWSLVTLDNAQVQKSFKLPTVMTDKTIAKCIVGVEGDGTLSDGYSLVASDPTGILTADGEKLILSGKERSIETETYSDKLQNFNATEVHSVIRNFLYELSDFPDFFQDNITSLPEDKGFRDKVISLIRKQSKRSNLEGGSGAKDKKNENESDNSVSHSSNSGISLKEQTISTFKKSTNMMEALFNVMLHGAAGNKAKSCGKCVSDCGKQITTATDTIADHNNSPEKLMGEKNLKSTLVRSVHGESIMNEPPAILAQAVTNSFEPNLRIKKQRQNSNQYQNRCGAQFMKSRHAWEIEFKCFICAITTSSIILQNANDINNVNSYVPEPNQESVRQYLSKIISHDWRSDVRHENFKDVIKDKDTYIKIIHSMLVHGRDIFIKASECRTRQGAEKFLLDSFKNIGVTLDKFHIQVIMRTIEMCIHEPFGEVKFVSLGYGSLDAANLIISSWSSSAAEGKAPKKPDELPQFIVEFVNSRAKEILNGTNKDITEEQLRNELIVLELRWDYDFDCLVHDKGIGKKLDASDTEHLLCLFYKLIQNTFPSYNTNTTERISLHNPKHWPIRLDGENVAKLDFMKPCVNSCDAVFESYRKLINDEKYPHNKLIEQLRIDMKSHREKAKSTGKVGTRVSKIFIDENLGYERPFTGEVISYDAENALYKIQYEDGDGEEIGEEELGEIRLGDDEDDDDEQDGGEKQGKSEVAPSAAAKSTKRRSRVATGRSHRKTKRGA